MTDDATETTEPDDVDPAVLELAKTFVLTQVFEIAQAGAEDAEQRVEDLARLMIGDGHRAALAKHAEKMREDLTLLHAQAAVTKRTTEEQAEAGLAKIEAAQAALGVSPDDGARNPS